MVGYLTTYAGVRLDGMETMPTGFAARSPSVWAANPVAKQQVYGLILSITFLEFFVMTDHFGTADFPGDYRQQRVRFGLG